MKNQKVNFLIFRDRKGNTVKVFVRCISWCKVNGNIARVIDYSGDCHYKKISLKALLALLGDDFMQVFKSFLVRKKRIGRKKEDKFGIFWIYMKTKKKDEYDKIPVSRYYKKVVKPFILLNKRIKDYSAE